MHKLIRFVKENLFGAFNQELINKFNSYFDLWGTKNQITKIQYLPYSTPFSKRSFIRYCHDTGQSIFSVGGTKDGHTVIVEPTRLEPYGLIRRACRDDW